MPSTPPYGTFLDPDDLTPFATIVKAKAEAMIDDAEAQATLAAPCIADLDPVTDALKFNAVKSILRQAVLRWNEAGAGGVKTRQQTIGPFTDTVTTDGSRTRTGAFWPSEITRLQSICSQSSGRAFEVDTMPPDAGAFHVAR